MIDNLFQFPFRCMLGFFLFFLTTQAVASEDPQEIKYLFAGMLQERERLKSWSCAIAGMDPENLSFDMKILSNGECVRFTRTQHLNTSADEPDRGLDENGKSIKSNKTIQLPNRDEVVHLCDNKQTTVAWNETANKCNIFKSSTFEHNLLHLWDPRTAGLILDYNETDFQKILSNRLANWLQASKVEHRDDLWTITFTKEHEWQFDRLSLTIDTKNGFTPVSYRGYSNYKPNSRFPGKTEVYYESTAKWQKLNGVWVPVHHRHVNGNGTVVREYNISWNWINKDVEAKEFTIDALGLPKDVQKSYFDERGIELNNNVSSPAPNRVASHSNVWIRWIIYTTGFVLIVVALLRIRLRREPNKHN